MSSFEDFCIDYYISIASPDDKHYRYGWINVPCPFCSGNSGHHLGFDGSGFTCYRCGHHRPYEVFKELAPEGSNIKQLLQTYGIDRIIRKPEVTCAEAFNYIEGSKLSPQAEAYLSHRGIDPKYAMSEWGIREVAGTLQIPLTVDHEIVAQSQRFYVQEQYKYKVTSQSQSAYPVKDILFGLDHLTSYDYVVIVEGIFGVINLMFQGWQTVALLGSKPTMKQLIEIAKFKKVYLYLDNDDSGHKGTERLISFLRFEGVPCEVLDNTVSADENFNFILKG